jgi:hypothetical protein
VTRWLLILGGLSIWLVHFLGLYALASLADLSPTVGGGTWRGLALGFSAACLVVCGLVGWIVLRPSARRWLDSPLQLGLGAGGAAIGLVAIAWQTIAAAF